MTSNDQDTRQIERLLHGFEPPVPPPEMRSQVLTPALHALQREPQPDLWTRLWSSRPLRLAWTGTTAALIFGHLAVTAIQVSQRQTALMLREQTLIARAHSAEEELAEVVQLPRLSIDVQPRGGSGTPGAANDNNATTGVAATTEESSA